MEKIFGKAKELALLCTLLEKQTAQLAVIRGRNRAKKSCLTEKFSEHFTHQITLTGHTSGPGINAQMQRDEFADQLTALIQIALPSKDDWGALFRALARHYEGKKVLIILDEITWMGNKDPAFMSKLKAVWDTHFKKNPRLVLILSGSISSWIEKNILCSTGFVGRVSLDLVLEPLPDVDNALF